MSTYRLLAWCGLAVVLTYVIGIVCIGAVPDATNVHALDKALREINAHNRLTVVAGWMFAIGLAVVVPFTWLLVSTLPEPLRERASIGAWVLSVGAIVNVIGSLILVMLGHFQPLVSQTTETSDISKMLLGFGISCDATYNFGLFVGLTLICAAMRASDEWRGKTATLGLVTGILSLPVSLEWYSEYAAMIQYLSGGLFIIWTIAVTVVARRRSSTAMS
jgi:hypothetical protein